MPTVGEPIPDFLFERSQDATKSTAHRRQCESCKYSYRTVEIAMSPRWSGLRPTLCYLKPFHHGRVHRTVLPSQYAELERDGQITQGIFMALRHGAVYRRRKCLKGCKDYRGRKAGWSTMEVLVSGLVCGDVTECPRCSGFGKKQILGVPRPRLNRIGGTRKVDVENAW